MKISMDALNEHYIKKLESELFATQAREARLVEAIHSVLCDPEGNPCFAGSDGDRQLIQKALSNSTEHTEKWLAEHDANVLEDLADYFSDGGCFFDQQSEPEQYRKFDAVIAKYITGMANELRSGK